MLHHGSHGVASKFVRPQGTDTMGLQAHLRDGAPMALIVCVGSFRGGDLWVESGGLLNTSLMDKKWHTRVCKGSEAGLGQARLRQKPRCCSTPGHYMLHCHGRVSDGAWFFTVHVGCCIARLWGGSSLWTWASGCPMCSNPSS